MQNHLDIETDQRCGGMQAATIAEALAAGSCDFGFLHIKAVDDTGHERAAALKVQMYFLSRQWSLDHGTEGQLPLRLPAHRMQWKTLAMSVPPP